MKRFISVLAAIVLMLSNVPAFGTDIPEKTEQDQLIEDMILYYGCYGEAADVEIDGLLGALKKTDIRQEKLWEAIMDYWGYVNTGLVINADSLPENLPGDDSLALVILDQGLNADGSMKDELIRRLKVGFDCSKQYPNAYVACTGGGTAKENKEVTEAGQMGAWLLENGLKENRLILEDQSRSTIDNARYTLDILHRDYPQVRSVAIVSSDYHITIGSLLFEVTALMMMDEKEEPEARVVSNCAVAVPEREYTEDYFRGWQMYNMLQLIGEKDLAWQYLHDPEHFPRPVLHERDDLPDAA